MLYGLDAYPMAPMWKAASALAGTLFGAYLPDILVHNAAQKRREAIRKSLPDALDLMVICAEAGLSLAAPLLRVAEEMQKTDHALSDEFSLTGRALAFLPDGRPTQIGRAPCRDGG